MIPVFRPSYDEREVEAVSAVLRSGWIGLGPNVAEFETRFAEQAGARHAVALNSCTSALHLALHQLGIGPGDEVLVPTITFVSTASVVKQLGATPVFCDVDERTLLIDWDDARQRRTKQTKAVLPVLYAGQPLEVPDGFDLPAIYDCAHAAATDFDAGNKTCCWSFHAVKNLATGDGGMLTTDDDEFAARARRLRWLGIDKSTWDRTQIDRRYWWEYRIQELGFKCHMNDITAALGLVQLEKLLEMQNRRRELVRRYVERLPEGIERPVADHPVADCRSSWHLFVIRCDRRDELTEHLAAAQISSSVHYKPLHLYPCFESNTRLPVSESVWRRILTLPLYPDLQNEQVDFVCDTIGEFMHAKRVTSAQAVDPRSDDSPPKDSFSDPVNQASPAHAKRVTSDTLPHHSVPKDRFSDQVQQAPPDNWWQNQEREYLIEFQRTPERGERNVTREWLQAHLSGSVLDCGSGPGVDFELLRDVCRYTGMDVTPKMLEICREQFPQGRWVEGSIESIPFPDKSFDVVFCRHVLEHLHDYERAIDEMRRVGRTVVIVLLRRLGGKRREISIGHGTFDNTYDRALMEYLGPQLRLPFAEQEILIWSDTDRIDLKPLEESDLDFVRQLRNENRRWFFDTELVSMAAHQEWFERLQRQEQVRFHVVLRDGLRAGTISLTETGQEIEVGNVMLEPAYQGQGIMRRACSELLHLTTTCFARLKPNNDRSRRLFDSLGFSLDAESSNATVVTLKRVSEPAEQAEFATQAEPSSQSARRA